MNDIQKIQKAIRLAIETHQVDQNQKRKGKNIPYIIHPLTVGFILSKAGANADVISAGILHDTIEDSIPEEKVTYKDLRDIFGKRIAELVLSVSEQNKEELSWEERKSEAIKHIKNFSKGSLLIKSADVISNVSEIIEDHSKEGDSVFERFNAPEPKKESVMNNYSKVIKTILDLWKENPLASELNNLKDKKEYIRNGKKSCFESDSHLRMVWWLCNAGQLRERLSVEAKEEINQYIEESKDPNLWKI